MAPLSLTPQRPHYSGKVVVLIDETTEFPAEWDFLILRKSKALFVGSTAAGAGATLADLALPGGLHAMISSVGVYSPDSRPQRVTFTPDIEVRPTIAGVREGRDEVLEAGVKWILAAAERSGRYTESLH
jgi:hypothetical protein